MPAPKTYEEVVEHFTEGLARICGLYGASPLLGRLYGVLFLSPKALTLDEVVEAVGAAKSTVSVSLRRLVELRLVRRFWRKGDRRDHFEPVTDPRTVWDELQRLFVQPELKVWKELVSATSGALAGAKGTSWPGAPERAELMRRVATLDRLMASFELLLGSLEPPAPVEPAERVKVEFDS